MVTPNYTWPELKSHIDFVLDVFAEPPYTVLVCQELLSTRLDKLPAGSNVFIINVPFFIDCPSQVKNQQSFIDLFKAEFPYLNFCFIDGQYLVADLNLDYEDVFK